MREPSPYDIVRRAQKARDEAELAASKEVHDWYKNERLKLSQSGMEGDELADAERQLTLDVGARYKKASARAKRENTAAKVLERDARERSE